MTHIRQDWQKVPLVALPKGVLPRPICLLQRPLPPKSSVPAHSHPWGQLVYAYKGVLDVSTPNGRYLLPPQRAVWVPPHEKHTVASMAGAEVSSIYISVKEAAIIPQSCNVLEISPLLKELILESMKQPQEYDWTGPSGRLFRLIRDQIAIANTVPLHLPLPTDTRLLKICDMLLAEPANKNSLQLLARHVGASERTLQRLFKAQTGTTFQHWRQQLRIHISLQRIAVEDISITQLAGELGYDSTSAFIAMFQKQLGFTPGEYALNLNLH